jgi:hypothetical protein
MENIKTVLRFNGYLIVLYAIILHFVWAIALFFDTSPEFTTAISTLSVIFTRPALITTLFSVAFSALMGLMNTFPGSFFFLFPQQIILFISAGAAIRAMVLSQFADGVVRPRAFLIADQSPAVIAASLHFIALLHKMALENWEKYKYDKKA